MGIGKGRNTGLRGGDRDGREGKGRRGGERRGGNGEKKERDQIKFREKLTPLIT